MCGFPLERKRCCLAVNLILSLFAFSPEKNKKLIFFLVISDREELLLQDCEWKIRAIEKSCKDRLNAAEQAKQEAIKRSDKITAETQAQLEKVCQLDHNWTMESNE